MQRQARPHGRRRQQLAAPQALEVADDVLNARSTLAAAAASLLTAAAALAAAPRLPGHTLVVDRPGLRVYGPAQRPSVPCPRVLPLPQRALTTVKRAVQLAMPRFEAHDKLNGRDPVIRVVPATRSGFSYQAGGCGKDTWQKSIVAFVHLPHITNSASLSQHTIAVARVRYGWMMWAIIH
jgi:hypothetical protein